MKALKYAVLGLTGLIVLVLVVGFILPSEFHVQRQIQISAPADKVYPHIVNLREWKKWGVWFERDPDMQVTYTGPDGFVGQKSSWVSETQGSGEMTITELSPLKKVVYNLYFPEFGMGSTGKLTLTEENGTTTVIWADYGDVGGNPINHYFAAMMDGMVGPDFEAGLKNLKNLVESQ